MEPGGRGGGQHHQASARLAREAFRAAADPARFPEQIAEGLPPWQAQKFYFRAGFPFGMGLFPGFRFRVEPDPELTTVDLGRYDPLLGTTYAEIGSRARSMHKCQGMSQLIALPAGAAGAQYRLADTTIPGQTSAGEISLFDGVDTSLEGLARFAGADPPAGLTRALSALAAHAREALRGFDAEGMAGARASVMAGLEAVRDLRGGLGATGLSETARREMDFRLQAKERQFERAALLAHGVRLEALADDGVVTPGQSVTVELLAANRGDAPVAVRSVTLTGFGGRAAACDAGRAAAGGVFECSLAGSVPVDAAMTGVHWTHVEGADRYAFDPDVPFGAAFRPTPFRAAFELELGATRVTVERPVEHRYVNDIFTGEKRMELHVAPRLAVSMTPGIAVIPTGSEAAREVRVTVTNTGREPVDGSVRLEAPAGWSVTPAAVPVPLSREDESRTVRFRVSPAGSPAGEYRVGAVVDLAGREFTRGYQVVEYAHTERRHIGRSAAGTFKVIDVAIAPDLTVGYIEGVGDAVPGAIEQLGASLDFISPDDLAWGDLDRFDVIVTGVRAYERREDLRANNDRLLEYVARARDGHRPVQQVRVQPGAVRSLRRRRQPQPGDRRAGARPRPCQRPSGVRLAEPQSALRRGTTGCRNAACTSSESATSATPTSSSSRTRSSSTPA